MESQHMDDHAIDAIPGAVLGHERQAPAGPYHLSRVATASYLMHPLPDENIMALLLEDYFDTVHWFSLVIFEAKFRPAFDAVRTGLAIPAEKPFLLLLSTMLGLAAWYRGHVSQNEDEHPPEFWQGWSERMIANSESQIIDLMDQSSITAIQILILLGSYYVYHGRPNLSFSLLGATVKAAQAAGLHREPIHASKADAEQQKRVWWTIYTWDRFASITYGRPLGISDKDCNISQPQDVFEHTVFRRLSSPGESKSVCFSTYQRELNKLYTIASPAIENIYSASRSTRHSVVEERLALVKDVTVRLWKWRKRLPEHLSLSLDDDCPQSPTTDVKAYWLQSLSLHLTFDSLIIVLHRPFIKQRPDTIYTDASVSPSFSTMPHATDANHGQSQQLSPSYASESSLGLDTSSHQQWWEAAFRTSRVTGLPQLAQFATDSHLVAFLAINLFNAAMVMVVVALSDPLTNDAQEAKRAVARIYRLQETLGSRSTLSEQSSRVLESLVQLLLRRESDAILAPMLKRQQPLHNHDSSQPDQLDGSRISVRDALSKPLATSLDPYNQLYYSHTNHDLTLGSRLDDSLATVQRAFTTPIDGNFAYEMPPFQSRTSSIGQLHTERTNLPGTDGATLEQMGVTSTVADWTNANAIADNGLYWFWDPAWDNMYSSRVD
ncbi:hypothetical protein LTR37_012264 [Vermiconidia calcicola]|uniref:Uncharacterized protein n=1 Tax=Vermiconidia calcicola TaxID=1690605 RepID=A0ACC3MZV0_9PEZI|nr:hypothetical protein LTR37_012264 [Vermiconidia calcicola]